MKSRKNPKANVDRHTGLFGNFFLLGMVVSVGLVIVAFQWRSYDTSKEKITGGGVSVPEESQIAEVTKQKKKKPKQPSFPYKIEPVTKRPSTPKETKREKPKAPTLPNGLKPVLPSDDGEKTKPEPELFVEVEQVPRFPGGRSELLRYLGNNTQYPRSAKEAGIEGTVIVNFVVNKDGSITNVQVGNGVTEKLNKEAIRVVKSMPEWNPGKQRGKPVRVRYRVPIRFSIN